MQICRAFKTPTTLLQFLLRVNSQQTAADQYRCSIGLSIGDTDTTGIGPIPIPSTGIGLSLVAFFNVVVFIVVVVVRLECCRVGD